MILKCKLLSEHVAIRCMQLLSAVWLFSFAVNGVATVAGHVAEKMAPHVKKHGAKLVPESLRKSKDGRPSNFDGAKLVAASSIQGTARVVWVDPAS